MLRNAAIAQRKNESAGLVLRPAGARDEEVVAHLHDGVWREMHHGLPSNQIIGSAALDRRRWSATCAEQLIVEYDGKVIGFGVGGAIAEPCLKMGTDIQGIYVCRNYRFRGVGSCLAAALARRLACSGACCARLRVSPFNVAAVAFARALGASVEAEHAGTYRAIDEENFLLSRSRIALFWDDINALAAQRHYSYR